MLSFVCNEEIREILINDFVSNFADIMRRNELKTLACDYFDEDLEDGVLELIEETPEGFDFDSDDEIGEEPYGYVMPFFEAFMGLLEGIKQKYPTIAIDGYVFVNDLGCSEYVCRQRVYSTKEMEDIQFIDQLQCVVCHKWIDAKDVHTLLMEDEIDFDVNNDNSEEWLYPSGYHTNGTNGEFCVCSEECSNKI